jgi:hypothetical protein
MAFQNTTLSNIDNLNLGIPINQNVETDILSQDELNAIIMSQMGNNNPIQTIPVSPTIVQQEVQQEVQQVMAPVMAPVTQQPNYVNHPIYPTTTNTVPDKYEIDPNNVEDWEQEEADTTSKTWIEQMSEKSEKSEKTVKQKDQEFDDDDSEKDDKKTTLKDVDPIFDLEELYTNFNKLKEGVFKRISKLEEKQQTLDSRVKTLEKFIKLDEAELATQYINKSKENSNTHYIKQLTSSILNKTELLTMTMDVSLKHENLILSWNKELFNIEKEKVSSYTKIKNLNKATQETESDVNDIISKVNEAVKKGGISVADAQNELQISGYSGKPFN